ncbi:MAG: transaldolase family protein, partial [Thermoguttaceae bacterium]
MMALLKDQPPHKDQSPQQAGGDPVQPNRAGDPLGELQKLGQSVWLDYIRRDLIDSGELQRKVAEEHLSGITSNPSIFEKAIAGSTDYDGFLASAAKCKGHNSMTLYEGLAIKDVKDAADVLRPIYERTGRVDGYVSLEVSPYLAHDTKGTVAEAHRLWDKVGRENILIKIPGTPEGLPAIRQLIAAGINVNITLLFSQKVYEQVAGAYIEALEELASGQGDVGRMGSVASFFVSRIDTSVDAIV